MTPVEHTPGPWEVFEHVDHSGLEIGPPYDEQRWPNLKGHVKPICSISGRTRVVAERANARLIAASPELLEALKMYFHLCGNTAAYVDRLGLNIAFNKAESAIAKAEGYTENV